MHDVLKIKFNPKQKVNRVTGECFKIGGSTTELNTAQFEEYCFHIRTWANTELDFLIMLQTNMFSWYIIVETGHIICLASIDKNKSYTFKYEGVNKNPFLTTEYEVNRMIDFKRWIKIRLCM